MRRLRRRYIAVKFESERSFDKDAFYDAVWASVLRLFGECNASRTELALIEYDPQMKQAILRCSLAALDLLKASIVAITEIKGEKSVAHIALVSGTLKSIRKKMKLSSEKHSSKHMVANMLR